LDSVDVTRINPEALFCGVGFGFSVVDATIAELGTEVPASVEHGTVSVNVN
jgi:hypothetical protein